MRHKSPEYDAVIVGSGPNGLSAGITLAEASKRVIIFEANKTVGGGTRTDEITLPGFKHDICAAILPLTVASPFFKELIPKLDKPEFIFPPIALAHPFEDGSVAFLDDSLEISASTLGKKDSKAYLHLMRPLVEHSHEILEDILCPIPLRLTYHRASYLFGLRALNSARGLADKWFDGKKARALLAGLAGHSMLRLESMTSAAIGLVLGMLAHTTGWPMSQSGSQTFINSLAEYFISLEGEIHTGEYIRSLSHLPATKAILFDVTPVQLVEIAGDYLPGVYRRKLKRYRYGMGVFKIDYALSEPIPWKSSECSHAGTLHIGGTFEEIAAGEREVWRGEHPERPFVLLAQQSLFDLTRAPDGNHTAWAYCHVPPYSNFDMTGRIEAQIERFAPGFRDIILARNSITPIELESYNPNYIGGDINGGVSDWRQLFTRPVPSLSPYVIPAKGLYLCSSSTPPGGGVHGMCGYNAAQAVLAEKAGIFDQ